MLTSPHSEMLTALGKGGSACRTVKLSLSLSPFLCRHHRKPIHPWGRAACLPGWYRLLKTLLALCLENFHPSAIELCAQNQSLIFEKHKKKSCWISCWRKVLFQCRNEVRVRSRPDFPFFLLSRCREMQWCARRGKISSRSKTEAKIPILDLV